MEATFGLTGPLSVSRGWPRLVKLPNPAAGAAASLVVGGKRTLRVLTAVATLTASAQEVTRAQHLVFKDADGALFFESPSAGAVVKSTAQTSVYAAELGYNTSAATGTAVIGIPSLLLPSGMEVELAVNGLQSEDQLSGVALLVEEWPNGPDGYPTGVQPAVPLEATT